MTVRNTIVGATGMRKTRAGRILIKFDRKVAVGQWARIPTMRQSREMGVRVRGLVKLVTDWCTDTGLRLAREKTEVILLTGKRVPRVFNLDVGGGEIATKEVVKYLGVLLDNARRHSSHLEQACDKAEKFVNSIRSLLPNVNRPTDSVRRLYYGVWESDILYAAPIWASAPGMVRNKIILISIQMAALVRTLTAYRRMSHGALCVVTGNMPIHIKAKLRWEEYVAKRRYGEEVRGEMHDLAEERKRLLHEAEDRWKIEWLFHNPDNWMRRLIRNSLVFVRRKRRVNHYVMQIRTGCGIFNHYRHKIGMESHTSCWDCVEDPHDAEHVLFKCPRWVVERTSLECKVDDGHGHRPEDGCRRCLTRAIWFGGVVVEP